MMALLFLLMACIIGTIVLGQRTAAITLLLITLVLCAAMLAYHATSTLQVNW